MSHCKFIWVELHPISTRPYIHRKFTIHVHVLKFPYPRTAHVQPFTCVLPARLNESARVRLVCTLLHEWSTVHTHRQHPPYYNGLHDTACFTSPARSLDTLYELALLERLLFPVLPLPVAPSNTCPPSLSHSRKNQFICNFGITQWVLDVVCHVDEWANQAVFSAG